jgi:energy-coupling factor transporter ATP-binding protein EcfA2
MALLELEEVRAGYGPTSVLHGVSLSVPEGEVVSLLGANGAGKTTTLRAITGGVRWTGGIRFAGRSLNRMHTEDVVRCGIAHVPEGRGILTELTVDENLKLGSHLRRDSASVRKDYDRVFEYFPVLRDRRRLSASNAAAAATDRGSGAVGPRRSSISSARSSFCPASCEGTSLGTSRKTGPGRGLSAMRSARSVTAPAFAALTRACHFVIGANSARRSSFWWVTIS